ncbi:hypothetical protein [Phenylobacterium deserti]|uniref:Uncharacterized protein n=1 Tax=Phenylobacterium deserti TaxID=1914756 RepID=A0A328AA95_9CAUL|nr:hypothetical protein [Phenylobacterium deserti]RAK51475.1 hypothetical protein DJ018_16200 [Phenylobacterium deserti]
MYTDDALRQGWVRGLNAVSGKQSIELKHWLKVGTYAVESLSTLDRIVLRPADIAVPLGALACDVNRTCISSIETAQSIAEVQGLPKSLAWMLIKLYYSSFFAANALLRIQGVSCSYLDIEEVLSLRRVAHSYGMRDAAKISSGQYLLTFDMAAREIVVEKNSRLASHEFVWSVYVAKIGEIRAKLSGALLASAYVKKVDLVLASLQDALNDQGRVNGNWLSQVRNAVNYRQELGVWYPYQGKRQAPRGEARSRRQRELIPRCSH